MFSQPLRGFGFAILLVLLVTAVPSRAVEPDTRAGAFLSPDAAVAAALEVHPQVRAAEAELARAEGAASEAAAVLSNPSLSLSSTLDGARSSAQASLPISLAGAGWHQRALSRAELDAARSELDRARLVAAAGTRRTYTDAVVATGRVRVALEGQELAARLSRAVRRLNEEGEASTLDLRLARLAEVQAAAGLMAAREAEAEALSALSAAIGQPLQSDDLAADPLAAAPDASAHSSSERSDITAARQRLEAAEADLRLQRSSSLPPVSIGAFAELEDGETFVGPALSFELPLFRRNQGGRRHADAQVLVANAAVTTVGARAQTEVSTATRRVAEAQALSEALIDDPIAEARAALASIEAGTLAGEIDLPSAVLLQGEVLDGEAAAIDLLGRIASARIDLLLATDDPALLGGAP